MQQGNGLNDRFLPITIISRTYTKNARSNDLALCIQDRTTRLPVAFCLLKDCADCAQDKQYTAESNSKSFHNFSPHKVGKVGTTRISFISSGKELALLMAKSSDPYPWVSLDQTSLHMSNIFFTQSKKYFVLAINSYIRK